jgi:hypothetical protein
LRKPLNAGSAEGKRRLGWFAFDGLADANPRRN